MADSVSTSNRSKTCVMLLPTAVMAPEHEQQTHRALGRRIGALLGLPFLESPNDADLSAHTPYFIPQDTLVGPEQYRRLGIETQDDFFGGLVAEPFMGSKAISHPLCPGATQRPPGWVDSFHHDARRAVLAGFTAFCAEDALRAAAELFRSGPLRVKPVLARAGKGQFVVNAAGELEGYLKSLDHADIATWGLVLEENLNNVATYSVGEVRLGGIQASYCGTQQLTMDNDGALVYGGSSLHVVRGDYAALLAQPLSSDTRQAVALARVYDAAADAHLPGFMASRRNYDVAVGTNSRGRQVSGVLEQSWRIGGASSAEVLAMEILHASPATDVVRAETIELYGEYAAPPAGATIVYSGKDPEVGHLTKCVRIGT